MNKVDIIPRQDEHRKALMLAIRALPLKDVLDLVAAGIDARPDLNHDDLHKFLSDIHTVFWPYVGVESDNDYTS